MASTFTMTDAASTGDRPVSLQEMKDYLRLVDDGGQDNLLQSMIDAAEADIRRSCSVETATTFPEPLKQTLKMMVAGWYANPEAFVDRDTKENPALARLLKNWGDWGIG